MTQKPTLIFDCDGVLADTERFGHLPAFNALFAELNLPTRWSQEQYTELLRIGGGKERLATLLTPEFVAQHQLPTTPDGQRELLLDWHRRKTAHYTTLVRSGQLPPRPGIARIAAEAADAGWQLAVASTSAQPAVRAVLNQAVGPETASRFTVFAGDIVPHKKPAPDIYLHALRELGADPKLTLAVEDSSNGLRAATGAGLRTVVTVCDPAPGDDFSAAALVLSDLGEPDQPGEPGQPGESGEPGEPDQPGESGTSMRVLSDPLRIQPQGYLRLDDLLRLVQR